MEQEVPGDRRVDRRPQGPGRDNEGPAGDRTGRVVRRRRRLVPAFAAAAAADDTACRLHHGCCRLALLACVCQEREREGKAQRRAALQNLSGEWESLSTILSLVKDLRMLLPARAAVKENV